MTIDLCKNKIIAMEEFVRQLNALLTRGESVATLTVVTRNKSVEDSVWCKILVRRNGDVMGAARDDALKYCAIRIAKQQWASTAPLFIDFNSTNRIDDHGLGPVENVAYIFAEIISPDVSNLSLFHKLQDCINGGMSSLLLSSLASQSDFSEPNSGKCLICCNNVVAGGFLSSILLHEALIRGSNLKKPTVFEFATRNYFLEPFLPSNINHIDIPGNANT